MMQRGRAILCLAGTLAGMGACASASSGPPDIEQERAGARGYESLPDLFANDRAAFDYFVCKGLTGFQAAGIVGNLDQESGVDPTAVESGGPGRGIAQWSVGGRWDTASMDNVVWYAAMQGQSDMSLQLQLDFIWYELHAFPTYGLATLEASTTVSAATTAFQNDFEICSACDSSTRLTSAQTVLAAYRSEDAGCESSSGSSGGSDAGSGSGSSSGSGSGAGSNSGSSNGGVSSSGSSGGADGDGGTVATDGGSVHGEFGGSMSAGCDAAPGSARNGWGTAGLAALVVARRRRGRLTRACSSA